MFQVLSQHGEMPFWDSDSAYLSQVSEMEAMGVPMFGSPQMLSTPAAGGYYAAPHADTSLRQFGTAESHADVMQVSGQASWPPVALWPAVRSTIPPGTWVPPPPTSPGTALVVSPKMRKFVRNLHKVETSLRTCSSLQPFLEEMFLSKLDRLIPAQDNGLHHLQPKAQTPKKVPVRISLADTVHETPQAASTSAVLRASAASDAVARLVSPQVLQQLAMNMNSDAQASLKAFLEQSIFRALSMYAPDFVPATSIGDVHAAVAPAKPETATAPSAPPPLVEAVAEAAPKAAVIHAPPAGSRYRCLNASCGASFAKWLACLHHITSTPSCKEAGSTEQELHADSLQQLCKI